MIVEQGGWFVVNVRDARWVASPDFGQRCLFEGKNRFPETGVYAPPYSRTPLAG